MSAIRLPELQNTPAWLERRRTGITASEMPILAGNRPGLYALWAVKCGLLETMPVDAETQEMYDLGHALEPVIAERYTANTGEPLVRERHLLQSRSTPWLLASLDRRRKRDRRPVELKWTPFRYWPTDGPEPVPAMVQDQVQAQMIVDEADVADVAVLVGGKVVRHEVPADRSYQRTLLDLGEWFRDLVVRQEPPPVDGSEGTRQTIGRLHPRHDDELTVTGADIDLIVRDWYVARVALKAAKDREETLDNAVRAVLGDAAQAYGEGWRISYRNNAGSTKTDWKAVAHGYDQIVDRVNEWLGGNPEATEADVRQMLEHWRSGAIWSTHTQVKEGSRVLRPTFKQEATSWL